MAVNREALFICVLLSLTAAASSLKTLDTRKQLNDTGFGRPPPRHGYVLLVWYAQNCVDNNMVALCDPTTGAYGFHYFGNKAKGGSLLPELDEHDGYTYYSLGNLNTHRYKQAQDLPYEVRRYYDKHDQVSNMDRLLVKYFVNKKRIEEIYVSAHYESSKTYLIGSSLISELRKKPLDIIPIYQWHKTIVLSKNHNN